jgi:hypothetical protein
VIAFIGDRLATSHPHQVALPERDAWEWKMAPIMKDAVAAATFFVISANENVLWKLVGLPSTPESLPRLIYLPTQVAAFALEGPCMLWQVFQFIGNFIQGAPDAGPTEEDAALLHGWMMGGLQTKMGRNTQAWVLDLTPAVSTDTAFMEGYYHHISSVVGLEMTATPNPATNTSTAQGASPLKLLIAHMTAVVEKVVSGTSTLHRCTSQGGCLIYVQRLPSRSHQRYCSLWDTNSLPVIWALFQMSKHTEDHCLNLNK